MIFKCVILPTYIPDECNGDILTASGALKISEKIGTDLKIDFNHEENELKDIKLIDTEILKMSQDWGGKVARKGSLIGTVESTNDQVDECIEKGRIIGVSIHTRFNPDESNVCACEIEEKPEDKTFNNTENKECLIPKFLSLIGGNKTPCNGFEIMVEEKKKEENTETDVTKAELSEEKIGEIVANALAEGLKPLNDAISKLNVEKADGENTPAEEDKKDEATTETTNTVTEDSKDKLETKKAKPKVKTDVFGLPVVKIGE
ncbi:MAG: hypothetical protein ACRC1M_05775 [Methanobacteriaceae archaeon]